MANRFWNANSKMDLRTKIITFFSVSVETSYFCKMTTFCYCGLKITVTSHILLYIIHPPRADDEVNVWSKADTSA